MQRVFWTGVKAWLIAAYVNVCEWRYDRAEARYRRAADRAWSFYAKHRDFVDRYGNPPR